MRRGEKLKVGGWEAAETGGTQAEAKRHIKLRLRVVSSGRELLLRGVVTDKSAS